MLLIISAIVLSLTFNSSVDAFELIFEDGENVKWSNNCDFNGGDIGNVQSSREDCAGLCSNQLDCTHFAWNRHDGGTCWFKSGNAGATDAFYVPNESTCGYVLPSRTENTRRRRSFKEELEERKKRLGGDMNPHDRCRYGSCLRQNSRYNH